MNLHLLRIFVAVVEAGSFSRAAESLAVSQPAVSKAVRELESQLESVLLDRRGRFFCPTNVGQVLYDYGRSIFALEREAHEAVQAFYGLDRGSLTIGASTTIATYWLPPLVVEFQRRHPHVEIRVISENTKQIAELLIDCQVDVALVEGPVADPRLESRPWFAEEMTVISAGDVAAVEPEARALRPLAEEVWVVREEGSGSRAATDALLDSLGAERPVTIEVGSNEAVVQTVASGVGVGLVPRVCARDQLALGKVRPVATDGPAVERQLFRVRLPHRTISQAAITFEALLAERARDSEDGAPLQPLR